MAAFRYPTPVTGEAGHGLKVVEPSQILLNHFKQSLARDRRALRLICNFAIILHRTEVTAVCFGERAR